MRMNSVIIAMCSVFYCAANPQFVSTITSQAAQTAAAPERVASDTQHFIPGGAQFTVPAGWSIATEKNLVLLTPPEGDTHLVIVDMLSVAPISSFGPH
jgi:hypothetical protein